MPQSYKGNNKYEILTPNGWEEFEGIIKNFNITKKSRMIELEGGTVITATMDHRFYDKCGEELVCEDIVLGDDLKTSFGDLKVISIEEGTFNTTYDIFNATNHVILVNGGVYSHQCDELAFVEPRIAKEFWTSLSPTLSTGGKVIITSTPNTDEDQYAEIWFGANRRVDANGNETELGENGFSPYLADWRRHPDRDEAWAIAERASIGDSRFEREHACVSKNTSVTLMDEGGNVFSITMQELFEKMKFQAEVEFLEFQDQLIDDGNLHE